MSIKQLIGAGAGLAVLVLGMLALSWVLRPTGGVIPFENMHSGLPPYSVTTNLLAGDSNSDYLVNILDFSIMASHMGGYDSRADYNLDGLVDISDFDLLRSNFGLAGAPPNCP